MLLIALVLLAAVAALICLVRAVWLALKIVALTLYGLAALAVKIIMLLATPAPRPATHAPLQQPTPNNILRFERKAR